MRIADRSRDLVLAAGVAALSLAELGEHDQVGGRARLTVAVALLVVAGASLVARQRAPLAVLLVSAGCAGAVAALGHRGPVIALAPVVALYTAGTTGGRLRSVLLAALSGAVTAAGSSLILGDTLLSHGGLAHGVLAAAPVFVGEAVRVQRTDVALARERAELAALDQEQRQRRRVEEERRRIARDLHDVVAHALTTINVQAAVAGHLLDDRPAFARDALATINGASRTALRELRGIVGLLRESELLDPPSQPGPGLAGIDDLVSQAGHGGVQVGYRRSGSPPEGVPESVQVAAFRIVQEALTNIRRHAGAVAASVRVEIDPDRVQVLVRNEPATTNRSSTEPPPVLPPQGDGGAGLLGMRERALLLGGEFEAGPRDDGGFQVRAELPYRESR